MQANTPVTMPALALRGLTIFPNMLLHFDVGRESSIKALDEAMTSEPYAFAFVKDSDTLVQAFNEVIEKLTAFYNE